MDETRSGVFNLVRSSLEVQVNPCERCSGIEHGKTLPNYQPSFKLLIGTIGITDNDDDTQGTVVQFAWCEKGLGIEHHAKSFD